MSRGSDNRLEQLLKAEKAIFIQALDEQISQYHQKIAHSIRQMFDVGKANETGLAEQTDDLFADHHNDVETLPSSRTEYMQMQLMNHRGASMPLGSELDGVDGDIPKERSIYCDFLSYNDEKLFASPHKETAHGRACMAERMDSASKSPPCNEQPSQEPQRQELQSQVPRTEDELSSSPLTSCCATWPQKEVTTNEEMASAVDAPLKDFLRRDAPSGSKFGRAVQSPVFDVITTIFVVSCCVMMAVEVQYAGIEAGYRLKSPGFTKPASHAWPHAQIVLAVSDLLFNVVFTIELLVRIAAMRQAACRSGWMYFDVILVASSWLSEMEGVTVAINPMILRLARLARLGRVIKLLRNAQVVETLFLLIRSIQASFGCLVWSFSIVWFFQIVMAILMSQLLYPVLLDESKSADTRRELFKFFGTFLRGSLTMFEVTMGNWVPVCRFLFENVSPWYGALFVGYRCCLMFAILKVITAVFIAETTRCANSDDELAVQKKQKQRDLYQKKLADAFRHLDVDGNGIISWDEFEPLITNPKLKTWLSTLDIDTHDLMTLYRLYERGDHHFDLECFIEGMTHVKGPAKSIDVLKLLAHVDTLNEKIDDILNKVA